MSKEIRLNAFDMNCVVHQRIADIREDQVD
jgi:hypothetical protein